MRRRPSILDGVDLATLEARRTAMQQAHMDLSSGAKVQVASYSQGDGSRTVTYTMANIEALTQAIISVQTRIDALNGVRLNRRAPMTPVFNN